MGQKVNPIGLRIGVNHDWSSHWYANKKDYATNLKQDHAIRGYLTLVFKIACSHTSTLIV